MRCGLSVRRTALSHTAFPDCASTSESAGCLILNEAIVRLEGGGEPPGLWLLFRSPWRLRDRISTLLLPDHDLLRPTRLPLVWDGTLAVGAGVQGHARTSAASPRRDWPAPLQSPLVERQKGVSGR